MTSRRVVSLTCSNTEIVAALGQGHLLVGVDDHSDFPVELVADLPRVGPDLGIDLDAVAALDPDLVLASLTVPGHEKIVEALERTGLPHIAPNPQRLDDVYRDIETIAGLLGVPDRGATLVASMRQRIVPRPAPPGGRPRLAVQWWPKPAILPGRSSWADELIELAGGRNVLADDPCQSRPVDWPELRHLDPEAFILSWCGVPPDKVRPDVVRDHPELQGIRAIEADRIYQVTEALLGRPGPRLVEGYEALVGIVEEVAGARKGRFVREDLNPGDPTAGRLEGSDEESAD